MLIKPNYEWGLFLQTEVILIRPFFRQHLTENFVRSVSMLVLRMGSRAPPPGTGQQAGLGDVFPQSVAKRLGTESGGTLVAWRIAIK
jgi:hypothetical protein